MAEGTLRPSGTVTLKKGRNLGNLQNTTAPLSWKVQNFLRGHFKGIFQHYSALACGHLLGSLALQSSLSGVKFSPDMSRLNPEQRSRLRDLLAQNTDVRELVSPFYAEIIDYGVLSYRVVTNAGVAFLANNFAAGGDAISSFKFHGFGTGTTAEAATDTGLVTELTTQYAVSSTRPTGSQSSSSNIYTTIGTLSPGSGGTIAITEQGVFSASSGATLWDRSVFSAVNLVAGSDSLQVTYNLTLSAGG